MFLRLIVVAAIALIAWASLVRPSEGAGPDRAYVIRTGDTLWSIAEAHYSGDPRAGVLTLQRRNRLEGAIIRPGERIVLP